MQRLQDSYANGKSHLDGMGLGTHKKIKSLSGRVTEALKRVEAEDGINLGILESMSYNKAEKVIKIKYSSMSTTRCQKIGSIQNQMEKELIHYITDLLKNNQRVKSKIMFQKVIEVIPMFKGRIDTSTFLKDAKNWFYYGFKPRHNLRYLRISGASRKCL